MKTDNIKTSRPIILILAFTTVLVFTLFSQSIIAQQITCDVGVNGGVKPITAISNELFIGGCLIKAGDLNANNIAKWDDHET